MGADALVLTLLAALVHAAWNALLAGARDSAAASAVALMAGTVVFAPVALATGDVDSGVWPFVAASAALETLYISLLAVGYSRADMSVIYPVARGTAPVLVLAVGGVPGLREAIGVLVVVAGIVVVRRPAGGGGAVVRADLGLAMAVGACIAAYTLVDARGVEHASPLTFLWLKLAPAAVAYGLAIALRRGGTARLRQAATPRAGVAGIGFFGAYGLVLSALTLAPAAAVAAVRETSVVFGVLLARLTLGEPVGRGRVLGAVVVLAGIALVA